MLLIDACSEGGEATGCMREAVRQALACDCERAPLFALQRGTAVLGDRKIVGGKELSRKRLERMRRRRFSPRERVIAGLEGWWLVVDRGVCSHVLGGLRLELARVWCSISHDVWYAE